MSKFILGVLVIVGTLVMLWILWPGIVAGLMMG